MSGNFDIIELLINRNLLYPSFQIFSELDINSLAKCRSACSLWKNFIDYNFFELSKGREWVTNNVKIIRHMNPTTPDFVRNRIISNILNNEYEPTNTIIPQSKDTKIDRGYQQLQMENGLFHIEADDKSVCVSTSSGYICNYENHTFEHIWTLKIGNGLVQHYMNNKKVFAVTANGKDGNVFVIDRNNGCLLHTLMNVHSILDAKESTVNIFGVRVFDDRILATADENGFIKFHHVDQLKLEIISPQEVEEMLISQERRPGGAIAHLDHDGNKLVSGSFNGEVIAWDFNNGKILHQLDSECEIYALRIGTWPLVATCTMEETDDENRKGIKIFNMEKQLLLRHIMCDCATYVNFYDNILIACGNFDGYESWPSLTIGIWNMSDLMDQSKTIEDVGHREISPILNTPHCSLLMIGSSILTTEGMKFVQRSFWP